MKYLLLNYMNEKAMLNLPKEEAGRMHADYLARLGIVVGS